MFAALLGVLLAAVAPAPAIDTVPFGLFSPSDMSWTLGTTFVPDNRTVYFTKSEPNLVGMTIFRSELVFGKWTTPEIAPFSGQYADSDPVVTVDGSAVIFSSHRTPLGSAANAGLYEAFLSGPRSGAVVPLPNSANALGSETSPSLAQDGSIYFTLNANGVRRIYRAASMSETPVDASPVVLPGDIPGIVDRDVAVDPAQHYIVFSSIRPNTLGSFDLYVAFHQGDRWCAPTALPAPVNSAASEIAPALSHDGNTLYFASNRVDIVQPSDAPIDAAGFAAELAHYQDGTLREYSANVGPWIKQLSRAVAC